MEWIIGGLVVWILFGIAVHRRDKKYFGNVDGIEWAPIFGPITWLAGWLEGVGRK